jgi:hypothetical protein
MVRGIVKKPPYDSSWGSEYRQGSGGSRYMEHYENKLTGEIKCRNMMELKGADFDYSLTDIYSEILIWYQMPVDGFIDAWFALLCIETPYSGEVSDEFEYSDAYTEQRSACYLGTSQPQSGKRVFADLLYYIRETDGDDISWSGTVAQPGEHRFLKLLYSPQRFVAGQQVLVAIGIHDIHYAVVDDMSFDMTMTNHWIVEQVDLSAHL